MSNNLDHLFKKALHNRTCEPPPHIWENIEANLNTRRRKYIPWWIRSVAAVALVAAAIWLLQLREKDMQEIQWVKVLPPGVEVIECPELPIQPVVEDIPEQPRPAGQPVAPAVPVSEGIIVLTAIPSEAIHAKIESTPSELSLNTTSLCRDMIPLVNGQAIKNAETYYALLKAESQNTKTNEEEKEKNERHIKLALSGHVAPVYTSGTYHTTATNARGYQYSDSQMSGTMNVSGGLKFSVASDKKLSVQTGLFYSRMGQHTNEKISSYPQTMAFAANASRENYDYIVTPLGNLKSRTKATAYRSEEAILLSNNNDSRTADVEQVFNTVEIPLALRYRFFDQKLRLSIAGGFSGNIVVDNKVYMIKGNEKEYVGSTEDIRRFNLSTDLGFGIEYPIARNVKIMLEPGFKYYLQSLSRNSQIDFKPYTFSLSTGIGIEF